MMKLSTPTVRRLLNKGRRIQSEESIYPGRYSLGFVLTKKDRCIEVTWNCDFTDKEALSDPKIALERKFAALRSCERILADHYPVEMGSPGGVPTLFVLRNVASKPLPKDDPRMQDLHDDSPQGEEDV